MGASASPVLGEGGGGDGGEGGGEEPGDSTSGHSFVLSFFMVLF